MKVSSLTRMVLAAVLSVFAIGPGAQQAPAPTVDPVKQQQQRTVEQPGNNAPVWRDVRKEAHEHYTSVKGRETGVLVQSAGDTWRRLRNGPLTFYGGWLVVLVCIAIAALYFGKGPIRLHDKPSGKLVERFSVAERWAHWVMGISFVVLGISGLVILFGKYVLLPVIGYTLFAWLTALAKNLHNFVAPLFIVSLLVFIAMFIKDNLLKAYDFTWFAKFWGFMTGREHVPSGRFNAGEKVWFWGGVVVLCLIVSASGLILLFPNFDQVRATMQQANIVHVIAALLVIAMSLGHIYMGTIGVEGSYQSMRTGYVDEIWAREHHEYWYNDVKAGDVSAKPANAATAPQAQH